MKILWRVNLNSNRYKEYYKLQFSDLLDKLEFVEDKHDKEYYDFYFFKHDIPTYLACNKQNKKH